MADIEEPKHFAFGDLNPVAKPRTAKRLDPKNTSVMDAIREVILGHYTSDALEGTGPYKGVVLRVEEDMDQNKPAPGNWLSTVFGPQGLFSFFSKPKTLKRSNVNAPKKMDVESSLGDLKKEFKNRFGKEIKSSPRPQSLSKGGRAGYKAGTRGCKLATKGKGRAYGKNS